MFLVVYFILGYGSDDHCQIPPALVVSKDSGVVSKDSGVASRESTSTVCSCP